MADWDREDVKAYARDMSTVDNAVIDLWIEVADRQIDPTVFGDRIVEAGSFLTAHFLALEGYPGSASSGGGGVGPVSQVTVGKVSVSYANPGAAAGASTSTASLSTTKYGLRYLALVALALPTPMVL